MATAITTPTVENVEGERGGHNRPRRPNAETLVYLKALPLDVTVSAEQVSQFLSSADTIEYPQILAAALSAIDEIRNEIASLAGDEDGAEIIEMLAHIAAPYSEIAARALLYGSIGYCSHLATHRYGSHVLQTILQLAVTSVSDTDMAVHSEAPPIQHENLPSLTDLIVAVVQELKPQVEELSIHLCGTHVLRTLVCILGGVKLVNQSASQTLRRGKKKNKKKKKTQVDEGGASSLDIVYELNSRILLKDSLSHNAIQMSLQELTVAMSGSRVEPPGVLQEMACHSSSGPLLIVLLRVLCYRDASIEWPTKMEQNDRLQASSYRQLGKLRPEPKFEIGSDAHKLALRLLCWQQENDNDHQKWAGDVIYGFSGEPRGSHVLETILKLCPDALYESVLDAGGFFIPGTLREYAEHEVSNFVVQTVLATARNCDQVTKLLKSLGSFISSGHAIDPMLHRRGVFWRAAESAAVHKVYQSELLEYLRAGIAAISSECKGKGMEACVPLLLTIKKKEKSEYGSQISLDPPGVRAIGCLLHFDSKLCKDILKGVYNLPSDELEMLAKDGLGSWCMLDCILDGEHDEPIFAEARQQLLKRLSGRWVSIATDRVGHHCVEKLFRALPGITDRKALVEELSASRSRLNGCTMGRSVVEACLVREFHDVGEGEWAAMVNKMIKKKECLKDMLETENLKEEKKSKKRSRTVSKNDDNQSKQLTSSIDTIMDAMTLPSDKKRRSDSKQ
jgi:hypothetical protein